MSKLLRLPVIDGQMRQTLPRNKGAIPQTRYVNPVYIVQVMPGHMTGETRIELSNGDVYCVEGKPARYASIIENINKKEDTP